MREDRLSHVTVARVRMGHFVGQFSSTYDLTLNRVLYRDRLKGVQILLSSTQAGPGRTVKQQQEEISRNHVQAFYPISVHSLCLKRLI